MSRPSSQLASPHLVDDPLPSPTYQLASRPFASRSRPMSSAQVPATGPCAPAVCHMTQQRASQGRAMATSESSLATYIFASTMASLSSPRRAQVQIRVPVAVPSSSARVPRAPVLSEEASRVMPRGETSRLRLAPSTVLAYIRLPASRADHSHWRLCKSLAPAFRSRRPHWRHGLPPSAVMLWLCPASCCSPQALPPAIADPGMQSLPCELPTSDAFVHAPQPMHTVPPLGVEFAEGMVGEAVGASLGERVASGAVGSPFLARSHRLHLFDAAQQVVHAVSLLGVELTE
ncbi:hypothetical protein C8R44DRAFT_876412 [Mycena epipterygia]|nr:hypothetical protein C8R44DRAFT_876412 [Mycena epipterygia]